MDCKLKTPGSTLPPVKASSPVCRTPPVIPSLAFSLHSSVP